MKKMLFYSFIILVVSQAAHAMDNNLRWTGASAGNFPTGQDLDAITANIRTQLETIEGHINHGHMALATQLLNNQELMQAVQNYPAFYRWYRNLLRRTNPPATAPNLDNVKRRIW